MPESNNFWDISHKHAENFKINGGIAEYVGENGKPTQLLIN